MKPPLRQSESARRVSAWEWTQTALLAANLIWTTFGLGGYRPEIMTLTVGLTAMMVVVGLARRGFDRRARGRTPWAAAWLLPFLGYAAINVLVVSPVRWLGWLEWIGWVNFGAVFWIALGEIESTWPRRAIFGTLVGLGIVSVLLACYQRFVDPQWLMLGRQQAEQFWDRASGPFGIPNSLAAFLLLLLPAGGALAFRKGASATERIWWGWVSVVFALGLLLTVSRGAGISLALALIAWPILMRRWDWKHRAILAVVVILALAGAAAILWQTSPKASERFARLVSDSGELSRPILWRAGWNIFREHPIVGSGVGSYHVLFERHRPERFLDAPQWTHNEYLNTLSDLGLAGFGLFFGAAIAIAIRCRWFGRNPGTNTRDWLDSSAARSGLAIGLLAFAIQLVVDFHFKIPALAMACAVVAALAIGRTTRSHGEGVDVSGPRRIGYALAALVVASVTYLFVRLYRAESLRYAARQAMDAATVSRHWDISDLLRRAEADLRRATRLAPNHAGAWADLAYALELQAFAVPALVGELANPAAEAAGRAVALSDVVPEFWIRLGVARDMQLRPTEARVAFEKAVSLAPRNSHAWYYYASHLSHDTNARDAALRAIATCLSLDPGNAAAEALRVKLNDPSPGAHTVP